MAEEPDSPTAADADTFLSFSILPSFPSFAANLSKLNLRNQGFAQVPAEVWACKQLTQLDIGGNPVTALEGIQALGKLRIFFATGCKLGPLLPPDGPLAQVTMLSLTLTLTAHCSRTAHALHPHHALARGQRAQGARRRGAAGVARVAHREAEPGRHPNPNPNPNPNPDQVTLTLTLTLTLASWSRCGTRTASAACASSGSPTTSSTRRWCARSPSPNPNPNPSPNPDFNPSPNPSPSPNPDPNPDQVRTLVRDGGAALELLRISCNPIESLPEELWSDCCPKLAWFGCAGTPYHHQPLPPAARPNPNPSPNPSPSPNPNPNPNPNQAAPTTSGMPRRRSRSCPPRRACSSSQMAARWRWVPSSAGARAPSCARGRGAASPWRS
eukprot:scaffold69042_cov54-Phaeocystis_antarctica.AAC.3